jgi:GNAT superfamily N-acetyltransferase
MIFRQTRLEDVDSVMEIILQAQEDLKSQGVDQWQNGYPNREAIHDDIAQNQSWVLVDNDHIVGTTMLSFGVEETYNQLFDGEWLTSGKYAVMHRVAVSRTFKGRGYGGRLVESVKSLCQEMGIHSIKIDTHEDNKSMQRMLLKNDFVYCGYIFLIDGAEKGAKRLAYEKAF